MVIRMKNHPAPHQSSPTAERKRILIVIGFFSPSILAGFTRYAREARWLINAFSVLHGVIPKGWRADGMLTTNVFDAELRRFVTNTSKRIPAVLHGCNDLHLPIPNVECDECAAGHMAAQHLVEQGHENFVYFQYSRNRHAMQRGDGFRKYLARAGRDCIALEKISAHGVGLGEWFIQHLARLPKPIGLYAEDDMLAASVIDAALDAGWRVPEDLAVVGNGNLALACDQSQVPITSVAMDFEEEAYQAAALLDSKLAGKRLAKQTIVLPPTGLIARQSTNSVAAQRLTVQRALTWMAARFDDPNLNVAAIARACGVSSRLLYNEFQADLLCTPMVELERLRLRKAKEILTGGNEKLESIAERCGFGSPRTFLRAFQRSEGESPTPWRRRMSTIAPVM